MRYKSVAERIQEFAEYHKNGDGECNGVVLAAWAKNHGLNDQEKYELAYLFSITYCVESAIVLFTDPAEKKANIESWAKERKPQIVFQSDRKYIRMKNSFERCLSQFYRKINDVNQFRAKVCEAGTLILDKAIRYVESWEMFGRFSAFLFLETFVRITGEKAENAKTIDWLNGNTATSGLMNVYGLDENAADFDKTGRIPEKLLSQMDSMFFNIKNLIAKQGGNPATTELETSLCAYRKFYKASRYNGYYLDRMLEEILKLRIYFPDVSDELLRIRSACFNPKYLGEKGGWDGIRKEMKKLYKESGIIP